jgi:GTP-binding protein
MFVDKAVITIKAGDGGNGTVSFLRLKGNAEGGPDGGNGGNGGNIVFVADTSINTLTDFYYKKKYFAENGERGGNKNCAGRCGRDLIIKVPVGTVIRDFETKGIIADLFNAGDSVTVLEGGRGGKGNAHFCTPTRKSPSFSQQGEKTEAKKVLLELKIIADVGLIGFPNAGKSTLLSVISQARPKIADYPFTTLFPNLGVVTHKGESFVAADIPGLIEGASEGLGLGHEFLRHIERTRMLIHVVDMSGREGRDPYSDYEIINKELACYSKELAALPQIVAANKMDLPDSKDNLHKFTSKAKDVNVYACSAATGGGVENILDACISKLKTLPKPKPMEFEPFIYEKATSEGFEIIKIAENIYEVKGGTVKTLIKNITLDDIDSFNYFQKQLKDIGINAALKRAGAKNGDTVIIGDVEFELID